MVELCPEQIIKINNLDVEMPFKLVGTTVFELLCCFIGLFKVSMEFFFHLFMSRIKLNPSAKAGLVYGNHNYSILNIFICLIRLK